MSDAALQLPTRHPELEREEAHAEWHGLSLVALVQQNAAASASRDQHRQVIEHARAGDQRLVTRSARPDPQRDLRPTPVPDATRSARRSIARSCPTAR